MKNLFLLLAMAIMAFAQPTFAQEDLEPEQSEVQVALEQMESASEVQAEAEILPEIEVPVPAEVSPVLPLVGMAIKFLNNAFPKSGPVIQMVLEVVSSIAVLFTLLVVFVSGVLRVPIVASRMKGSHKLADKIQAFHDKVIPWLKKLSIFNAPVKKK